MILEPSRNSTYFDHITPTFEQNLKFGKTFLLKIVSEMQSTFERSFLIIIVDSLAHT